MTLLLIIDMQNDFCKTDGALYVKDAEKDILRLGTFIKQHSDKLDHIILTQDNHHVIDISHPQFWEDSDGKPPEPFTEISTDDIENGKWKPRFEKEKAVEYIKDLERQGEFPHVIWPEHCIIGSCGAAIVDEIMEPVKMWAREGRYFDVVKKGTNPLTEHFGALKANVPVKNNPETQLNSELVRKFNLFDTILIAGEAKSHCVASTVRQMLEIDDTARKLLILEDCMSNVAGFETLALPVYEKAQREGVRFTLSTGWFK
jgi:nicotinamidase/pyrazinamidase